VKILQLVSCRGWSSDAYWAARAACELERRGHEVTLGCRAGTERRVIDRARAEGVARTTTFAFVGGLRPRADVDDVRRLVGELRTADVVHVHRGKEHWLAAVANRLVPSPRPLVRTRHIVQAVRPHAGNRWLYRHSTSLVVTVTDAIRRQYLGAGLLPAERIVTLAGGADADAYRPGPADPEVRAGLGGVPGVPLVGLVSGFRAMKGHLVVVDAIRRLVAAGVDARFVFIGRGAGETAVRNALWRDAVADRVTIAGYVHDLPAAMRALDVGLYTPIESDGMSRVVFEYLAAARPLVASRVGVVPEVLQDGEHALLVPAGDAGALTAAITALVADPARAARLGAAGRRLVDGRYSGARVAAALEAHYTRLVAAGAAASAA
jgi:glycosyltransferase involved in cell wall biosynthesis